MLASAYIVMAAFVDRSVGAAVTRRRPAEAGPDDPDEIEPIGPAVFKCRLCSRCDSPCDRVRAGTRPSGPTSTRRLSRCANGPKTAVAWRRSSASITPSMTATCLHRSPSPPPFADPDHAAADHRRCAAARALRAGQARRGPGHRRPDQQRSRLVRRRHRLPARGVHHVRRRPPDQGPHCVEERIRVLKRLWAGERGHARGTAGQGDAAALHPGAARCWPTAAAREAAGTARRAPRASLHGRDPRPRRWSVHIELKEATRHRAASSRPPARRSPSSWRRTRRGHGRRSGRTSWPKRPATRPGTRRRSGTASISRASTVGELAGEKGAYQILTPRGRPTR